MKIQLDTGSKYIIEKLNKHGKRADMVGGCVRDFLLGKTPFDFDITTEATPSEMKEIFSSDRVVETGIKHGTLTVLYEGTPYEVTTYREDGEYLDHRHPTEVKFSKNIEGDLSRRDFTVNAIAYNEKDGVTDLFGGISDIEKRLIRAVGDPYKRFDEDALRILRAVRFSATLGFDIEDRTSEACRSLAIHLDSISGERIYAEWQKLIAGERAYEIIKQYPEIISRIVGFEPELPPESSFNKADRQTRILSLFVSQSDPCKAYLGYAERLRIDKKTAKIGSLVLSSIERPLNTLSEHLLTLSNIGKEAHSQLVELLVLLGKKGEDIKAVAALASSGEYPYTVGMLNVSGDDVMMLGISGKAVGESLNILLGAVISERVENNRDSLMNYLKNYTGSHK